MAKVDIDKLAIAVMEELRNYQTIAEEAVKEAVEETSRETVKELKFASPKGSRGIYSKSWKYKRDTDGEGKSKFDMIVYSAEPEYRLTHLLEHGHAMKRGGRTVGRARAFSHIKEAELHAGSRLLKKIKDELGG